MILFFWQAIPLATADVLYDDHQYDLEPGYYQEYGINNLEENFPIRVTVAADNLIDLYLVNEDQHTKYLNKASFSDLTGGVYQGITYATFEVTLPEVAEYWLVIDNTDIHGHATVGIVNVRTSIEVFTWSTNPPFGPNYWKEQQPTLIFGQVMSPYLLDLILKYILLGILGLVVILYFIHRLISKPSEPEEIAVSPSPAQLPAQEVTIDEAKFEIISPGKNWIGIIFIFLVLLFGVRLAFSYFGWEVFSLVEILIQNYLYAIIILGIPVISLLLWSKLGNPIAERILTSALRKWKENKRNFLAGKLFGLNLDRDSQYYIEANANDVDLRNVFGIFRGRMIEVISICLGLAMLLSKFILWAKPPNWVYIEVENELILDQYTLIVMAVLVSITSPLLAFWIVPLIWMARDLNVSGMTQDRALIKLEDHVRSGLLDKALGLAGLLLAWDMLKAYNETLYTGFTAIYLTTLFDLLWLVSTSLALPYLIGILYLRFFHQKAVNRTRKKVHEILPLGNTLIQWANENEISNFQQIYSLEMKRKFLDTAKGKIGLLLLSVWFLIYALAYFLYF